MLTARLDSFWPQWRAWIAITRLDKPVGSYLLLWPTFWALWTAAEGMPSLSNLIIFTAGVFLMRSAGCVINDYADREVDGHLCQHLRQLPLLLLSLPFPWIRSRPCPYPRGRNWKQWW